MKTISELLINIKINEIKQQFDEGKISNENKIILLEFSKLKTTEKTKNLLKSDKESDINFRSANFEEEAIYQLISFNEQLENALKIIKTAHKLTTIINNNS